MQAFELDRGIGCRKLSINFHFGNGLCRGLANVSGLYASRLKSVLVPPLHSDVTDFIPHNLLLPVGGRANANELSHKATLIAVAQQVDVYAFCVCRPHHRSSNRTARYSKNWQKDSWRIQQGINVGYPTGQVRFFPSRRSYVGNG